MYRWLSQILYNGFASRPDDMRCSFCCRRRTDVGPLVEGCGPKGKGGVFICRECVELFLSIFDQEEARRRQTNSETEQDSTADI
jgi:hypothetical protein